MSKLIEHYLWIDEPELTEEEKEQDKILHLLWLKKYHPRYLKRLEDNHVKI